MMYYDIILLGERRTDLTWDCVEALADINFQQLRRLVDGIQEKTTNKTA